LLASANALPVEDTDEVKLAKADFMASFKAALNGEHASLAPTNEYLQDEADVAQAKATFRAAFEDAEERNKIAPVAPVAPAVYPNMPYYNAYHNALPYYGNHFYGYNALPYYNTFNPYHYGYQYQPHHYYPVQHLVAHPAVPAVQESKPMTVEQA